MGVRGTMNPERLYLTRKGARRRGASFVCEVDPVVGPSMVASIPETNWASLNHKCHHVMASFSG